jgi:hypothetical protein
MLKLVESLATKAERAKSTTVEFFPLREGFSHRCSWCETYANGNPKSWDSFRAVARSDPVWLNVVGDVCADKECRISIQAKYSASGPSIRRGTRPRRFLAKPMTAPQQVEFGGPLESAISPKKSPPRLSRLLDGSPDVHARWRRSPPWHA